MFSQPWDCCCAGSQISNNICVYLLSYGQCCWACKIMSRLEMLVIYKYLFSIFNARCLSHVMWRQTRLHLFSLYFWENMMKTWQTSEETECLLAWYQLNKEKPPTHHLGDKDPSKSVAGDLVQSILVGSPAYYLVYLATLIFISGFTG